LFIVSLVSDALHLPLILISPLASAQSDLATAVLGGTATARVPRSDTMKLMVFTAGTSFVQCFGQFIDGRGTILDRFPLPFKKPKPPALVKRNPTGRRA
jgi:hypothetical protein